MSDLYEVLSDEDWVWAEHADEAGQILHAVLDDERPVDFDDDDYRDAA